MFDRVRVPARAEGFVAPLVVGDFLIVHVLVENARKLAMISLQGDSRADHG